MITLNEHRARLQRGYEYVIVPTEVLDIPLPIYEMLKSETPNKYYTINELALALGSSFVPVPYIKEGFHLVHWVFDKGFLTGEDNKERKFLKMIAGAGYVDMRDNLETVEEIDFESLTGNEFGIFSSYEITKVPKMLAVV